MSTQPEPAPGHEAENAMTPTNNPDDLEESQCIEDLDELIERAADAMWRDLAPWLADTEGRKRDREELGELIAEWEAEHGAITPEERAAARAQLYG